MSVISASLLLLLIPHYRLSNLALSNIERLQTVEIDVINIFTLKLIL